MSTKHTPLPWAASAVLIYGTTMPEVVADIVCEAPPLDYESHKNWPANAALIVRAVNSHDALVKALTECAEDLACEIEHRWTSTHKHPALKRQYDRDMSVVVNARAILRAATEGRITSGADQPGTAAIVPNQQDDGSKG